MRDLSSAHTDIKTLPKLRTELSSTEKSLTDARQRALDLGKSMADIQNPTKSQTRELEKAEHAVGALTDKFRAQTDIVSRTEDRLKGAGVDVGRLADEEKRLGGELERNSKRLKLHTQYGDDMKSLSDKRQGYRDRMGGTVAKGMALYGMASSAIDVTQAQGDLATLGVSARGLQDITKSAIKYTNEFAGSSSADFIRASYDIRSGISALSEKGVGEFTALSATTAAATKSTVGVMTNLFAKGYGIYRQQFDKIGATAVAGWDKMSQEERDIKFGEYFSAGISAAVVKYRTDGQQMSDAMSNLGAAATSAGYSMQDQLAILGNLQKTMSGSEAATKFRAFLVGAGKAGKELGIDFVGANGKLKRVPEILDLIHQKFGKTIDANEQQQLQKAFGTQEAVAMINLLDTNINGLRADSDDLAKSMAKGKEVTEEMAKAGQKGKEMELFKQQMQNLAYIVVKGLLPGLTVFSSVTTTVTNKISAMAEKYPWLAKVLGVATAGFLAASIGAFALGWAGTYVSGGLKTLMFMIRLVSTGSLLMSARMKAAAAASRIWSAAQWLLNAAMTANPIGAVIVAAVALAGIGLLIYKKWSPIKNFFINIWHTLQKYKGIVAFLNPLSAVGALLYKKWAPFRHLVDGIWNAIKKVGGFVAKTLGIKTKSETKSVTSNKSAVTHNTGRPAIRQRGIERNVDLAVSGFRRNDGTGRVAAVRGIQAPNGTVNNNKHTVVTIKSAPVIHIQGGDVKQVDAALSRHADDLERRLKNKGHNDRRTDLG